MSFGHDCARFLSRIEFGHGEPYESGLFAVTECLGGRRAFTAIPDGWREITFHELEAIQRGDDALIESGAPDALHPIHDWRTGRISYLLPPERSLVNTTVQESDLEARCLSDLDFSGCTFEGLDLSNLDLSDSRFIGTTFQSVRFNGADLHQADLTGAVFSTGTSFSEVELFGTRFERAVLPAARFSSTELEYAQFQGAWLPGSDFEACDVANADFSGCDLTGASFIECTGENVSFRGANLSDALINGSELPHADFREATLHRTDISAIDLTAADFSGLDFSGCTLSGLRAPKANFSGSCLTDANFETDGALSARGADFTRAKLDDADLAGADLAEAVFRGASMVGVDLHGADCTRTDFRWARLEDRAVAGAMLEGARHGGEALLEADSELAVTPRFDLWLTSHPGQRTAIQRIASTDVRGAYRDGIVDWYSHSRRMNQLQGDNRFIEASRAAAVVLGQGDIQYPRYLVNVHQCRGIGGDADGFARTYAILGLSARHLIGYGPFTAEHYLRLTELWSTFFWWAHDEDASLFRQEREGVHPFGGRWW